LPTADYLPTFSNGLDLALFWLFLPLPALASHMSPRQVNLACVR
jgi:hypothetical protein